MCISPRLRGGNRSAGGSLVTFAAILVHLQAEREGGDFVAASFNNFIPCIFLPGCAGGTGLPAALWRRLRQFWFASKRNGRVGILFWCLSTIFTVYIPPRLRGGNRFAGSSLVKFAAILIRVQAEREGGDSVVASFNNFIPCIFLPGCAGGSGLLAAL